MPTAAGVARKPGPAWPLSDRPGFLIRRVHQIHTSLFVESCAGFAVTPLQYSLLTALSEHEEADQTTLAGFIALDRTTTTGALKRLAARGLVQRGRSSADRRSHVCRLTAQGRDLLADIDAAARRAHAATLAGLSDDEAQTLVALLRRIVLAQDERRESGVARDRGSPQGDGASALR